MSTAPNRDPGSYTTWFAQSGFPPLHDVSGNRAYARRLCSYISDPSTVRARTLDAFGVAPAVGVIRAMRDEHLATTKRRSAKGQTRCEGKGRSASILKLVEAPISAPAEVELESAPEPKAEIKLERLPVAARGYLLFTAIDVIDACADARGISHGELIGSNRSVPYAKARNLCAAVLRARGNSLPNVGRHIRRDHSTICNAIYRFFSRDIHETEMLKAWESLAPCIAKACRSVAELDAVMATRK